MTKTLQILLNVILLVSFLILVWSVSAAYQQIQQLINAHKWVVHTHEVIETAAHTSFSLSEAQSELYKYLNSKDEESLNNIPTFLKSAQEDVKNLRKLTLDNPVQQQNLDRLGPQVSAKVNVLQQIINNFRNGSSQPSPMQLNKFSHDISTNISLLLVAINKEELSLLEKRNAKSIQVAQTTNQAITLVGSLGLLLLLLSIILLNYQIYKRNLAEKKRKELELLKNQFIVVVSEGLYKPISSIRDSLKYLIEHESEEIDTQTKDKLHLAYDHCKELVKFLNEMLKKLSPS